jgi:hypothetical protein
MTGRFLQVLSRVADGAGNVDNKQKALDPSAIIILQVTEFSMVF